MTRQELRNALCILRSIDRYELVEAGVEGVEPFMDLAGDQKWIAFRDDPYTFFIRADDDTAEKIWGIIERRMGR